MVEKADVRFFGLTTAVRPKGEIAARESGNDQQHRHLCALGSIAFTRALDFTVPSVQAGPRIDLPDEMGCR